MLRTVLVAISVLATLLATAGIAAASVNTLESVETAFDTLGTTGDEWSGATYNAQNHSLFVVDDEGFGFEIPLDADDNTVIRSAAREVRLDIESGDFEGVTWLSGNTYAMVSEDSGRIYVLEISPSSDYFDQSDAISVIETGISDSGNNGAEGLATDGEYYYVAKEFPPTLHKFSPDGTWHGAVSVAGHVADVSGVSVAEDGSFVIVSDQSRTVTTIEIDWDAETALSSSTLGIGTFNKAEGIALIGNHTLYVFGELANQTYGHWQGEIVSSGVAVYSSGDANCSGTLAIDDAYLISQVSVQMAQVDAGCSADANNDGVVNILDAYAVAMCAVNHPDCDVTIPTNEPT